MVKVLMGGNGKVFLGGSNGESPHGRQRKKFSRKYQTGWFEFPWKHYGSPPWWTQGKSSPENIRPGGLSFPGSIMEVLLGGGKGKVLQKISDRVV